MNINNISSLHVQCTHDILHVCIKMLLTIIMHSSLSCRQCWSNRTFICVHLIPPPHTHMLTLRQILSQFSWLAVHALAEAAEAASAPVRIGVSKPLGASSVLPEYQGEEIMYLDDGAGESVTRSSVILCFLSGFFWICSAVVSHFWVNVPLSSSAHVESMFM